MYLLIDNLFKQIQNLIKFIFSIDVLYIYILILLNLFID